MKVSLGEYRVDGSPRPIDVQIDKWDTWSLDYSLATIIHPALVQFRSEVNSYPPTLQSVEEWEAILDKMIFSFGRIVEDDIINEPESEKVQEGLDLFSKYYRGLWN